MPFLIRAAGDTNRANWTEVAEGALPQTISGLTAGSYEVARISGWSAGANVSNPAAATTFIMAADGPWFTDTANLPADTTRVEFEARLKLPALPTGSAVWKFAYAESTAFDLNLNNTGWTINVEDSAGLTLISATTIRRLLPPSGQFITIRLDASMTRQDAVLEVSDGNPATTVPFAAVGNGQFAVVRKFGYLATVTGGNRLPAGTEIDYLDLFVTTGGVRTRRTNARVTGPASTANAHPWKLPVGATGLAT